MTTLDLEKVKQNLVSDEILDILKSWKKKAPQSKIVFSIIKVAIKTQIIC